MIFFGQLANGQDVTQQVSCVDSTLKMKVDSLKAVMASRGFMVSKEASLTMESGYEMPIFVPMTENTWYDIAFIGDVSSNSCEVKVYDHSEREVVYQKEAGNSMQSRLINFTYVPKITEYHVIKTVQLNTRKENQICGYIIMFKKLK